MNDPAQAQLPMTFDGGLDVRPGNEARAKDLAARIERHRAAYYNGHPEISDAAFDALEDELRSLDPTNPVLARVGSSSLVTEWEKARHTIPMGSLNKATNEDELRAWLTRCNELGQVDGLGPFEHALAISEKLDGISLEAVYEGGRLVDAITRGDGEIGERITSNVRRMKGVPARIPYAGELSVRGEIILRLSDKERYFPDVASPRNAAAGTAKRFDGQGAEHLTVLFYDATDPLGATSELGKWQKLRDLGFATPRTYAGDLDFVLSLYARYQGELRKGLDYDIDGLVVAVDELHAQSLLGEVNRRPRGAIALKFPSPAKITRVLRIDWDTGPSGRVTPVAIVEPVELASAMVGRASLHNAGLVRALGIGVGDEVLVSRRNDVIPYVEEVVEKRGPAAEPPAACTVCGEPLVNEGEYLLCRNTRCRALVEGRIKAWVGVIGALEWGEKLVSQLVEAKLVVEPADLYRLSVADIANLERRGEKSATKCLAELRSKLPLPLPTFLAALGIEGFARESARLVVNAGYDTLDKLFAATEADLAALMGLGPIKAALIVRGIAARKEEIGRLLEVGVVPVPPTSQGPLAGKSFCFTGTQSRPRAELVSLVEKAGGRVLGGVTKDLSYLVLDDPESTSTKAVKARKYGTQLISEETLLALAAGGSA